MRSATQHNYDRENGAPAEHTSSRRRSTATRRRVTSAIIVFLVIVSALVMFDRYSLRGAEVYLGTQIGKELQAEGIKSATPQIEIDGVPFLTQVAGGDYHNLKIWLPDFSASTGDGNSIHVPLLKVRAQDVRVPFSSLWQGQYDVVAESVSGTGVLDYKQTAALFGQPGLTLRESGGKLIFRMPFSLGGASSTITGAAALTTDKGKITVKLGDVTVEGVTSAATRTLVQNYAKQLAPVLQLPALPLGLQVSQFEVRPDGLGFVAQAHGVHLPAAT